RERFYNKLIPLVEYINQRWADEKISLKIVPLSYLSTNNVGSFLTGINARLLIGTDVLGKFPQPLSWDISRFGIRELDRFLNYWTNSSFRRKSGNILDEVIYQQEVVLKLAQTALLSKGILEARKNEAANAFLKEFPNFRLAHIVDQAQHLRSMWPRTASNMNLKNFVDEARQFPQALRDYLFIKN
ncbi:hypothetical protein MUP77_10360, partial [Candidatus Bathyarchaeota archaeon]|nr:hypothetical protein [Candidatus Bathyarchaeota archaeon]